MFNILTLNKIAKCEEAMTQLTIIIELTDDAKC